MMMLENRLKFDWEGFGKKTKKFELYMVDNGKQSEIFREQHLEGDCRKRQETLKKDKAWTF